MIHFDIELRSVEFGDMVISTRPSITESGRFVIDTARDRGDLALTLVDIDDIASVPMFGPTLTIYRDFHGVQTGYTFYSFSGSFEQGIEGAHTPITEQEFNNILAEIDFEEWAFAWALWEDETKQILSMASQ